MVAGTHGWCKKFPIYFLLYILLQSKDLTNYIQQYIFQMLSEKGTFPLDSQVRIAISRKKKEYAYRLRTIII